MAAVIPYLQDPDLTLYNGDAVEVLRELPDESVDCCVTSPPYWRQRVYGVAGEHGLENTPEAYVESLREVFAEVRRVLHRERPLWLNVGDKFATGVDEHRRPHRMGQAATGIQGPRPDADPVSARGRPAC